MGLRYRPFGEGYGESTLNGGSSSFAGSRRRRRGYRRGRSKAPRVTDEQMRDIYRKQREEQKDAGFLEQLGKTFGGLGYAAQNVATAIGTGNPKYVGDAALNVLDMAGSVLTLDPLTGMYSGATRALGKAGLIDVKTGGVTREDQRPVFTQTMERLGMGNLVPKNEVAKFGLDFAGGLLTDPLMFVSSVGKGGELLAQIMKNTGKLPARELVTAMKSRRIGAHVLEGRAEPIRKMMMDRITKVRGDKFAEKAAKQNKVGVAADEMAARELFDEAVHKVSRAEGWSAPKVGDKVLPHTSGTGVVDDAATKLFGNKPRTVTSIGDDGSVVIKGMDDVDGMAFRSSDLKAVTTETYEKALNLLRDDGLLSHSGFQIQPPWPISPFVRRSKAFGGAHAKFQPAWMRTAQHPLWGRGPSERFAGGILGQSIPGMAWRKVAESESAFLSVPRAVISSLEGGLKSAVQNFYKKGSFKFRDPAMQKQAMDNLNQTRAQLLSANGRVAAAIRNSLGDLSDEASNAIGKEMHINSAQANEALNSVLGRMEDLNPRPFGQTLGDDAVRAGDDVAREMDAASGGYEYGDIEVIIGPFDPKSVGAKTRVTPEGEVDRIPAFMRTSPDGSHKIYIDRALLMKKYEQKAWTKPKVAGVEPLPEDAFKTYDEFEQFVLEHEFLHTKIGREAFECPKCLGKGFLPEYRHIEGGKCFLCDGIRVIGDQRIDDVLEGKATSKASAWLKHWLKERGVDAAAAKKTTDAFYENTINAAALQNVQGGTAQTLERFRGDRAWRSFKEEVQDALWDLKKKSGFDDPRGADAVAFRKEWTRIVRELAAKHKIRRGGWEDSDDVLRSIFYGLGNKTREATAVERKVAGAFLEEMGVLPKIGEADLKSFYKLIHETLFGNLGVPGEEISALHHWMRLNQGRFAQLISKHGEKVLSRDLGKAYLDGAVEKQLVEMFRSIGDTSDDVGEIASRVGTLLDNSMPTGFKEMLDTRSQKVASLLNVGVFKTIRAKMVKGAMEQGGLVESEAIKVVDFVLSYNKNMLKNAQVLGVHPQASIQVELAMMMPRQISDVVAGILADTHNAKSGGIQNALRGIASAVSGSVSGELSPMDRWSKGLEKYVSDNGINVGDLIRAGADPDLPFLKTDLRDMMLVRGQQANKLIYDTKFLRRMAVLFGDPKARVSPMKMASEMADGDIEKYFDAFGEMSAKAFAKGRGDVDRGGNLDRLISRYLEAESANRRSDLSQILSSDDVLWGVRPSEDAVPVNFLGQRVDFASAEDAKALEEFVIDAMVGLPARSRDSRVLAKVNEFIRMGLTFGVAGIPFPAFSARNIGGAMLQALTDPDMRAHDIVRPLMSILHDFPLTRWIMDKSGASALGVQKKARAVHLIRKALGGGEEGAIAMKELEGLGDLTLGNHIDLPTLVKELDYHGVTGADFPSLEALKSTVAEPEAYIPLMKSLLQEPIGVVAKAKNVFFANWDWFVANARTNMIPKQLASASEDTMRINSYMSLRANGVDAADAAQRVADAHIAYHYQSSYDRILRDWMPFVRFRIGSVPRLIARGLEDPKLSLPMAKMKEIIANSHGEEGVIAPDYVTKSFAIPLGEDDKGNIQFITSLGIIHEDIDNVMGFAGGKFMNPFSGDMGKWYGQEFFSKLHPFIRGFIQAAGNIDFHRQQPWTKHRQPPGWMTSDSPLVRPMKKFAIATGLLKEYKRTSKKTGKESVYYQTNQWYHPLTSTIGMNRIDNEIGKIFDDRLDWWQRVVNVATGIKISSTNEEREIKRVLKQSVIAKFDQGKLGQIERFFGQGILPPEDVELLRAYNQLMGRKPSLRRVGKQKGRRKRRRRGAGAIPSLHFSEVDGLFK